MLFAQAQDAQAGAEAVLRMDSAFEDVGDNASGVRPCLLGPADQPLRRPLGMFAVALGHVLDLGGVAALMWRAQMAGHTLVDVEALDGLCGQAYFELAFHQLVRHGVKMAVDFDAVVDVHPYFFPFGVDVRVFRQRLQRRLVEVSKAERGEPGSFLKGFWLRRFSSRPMAVLSSPNEKN